MLAKIDMDVKVIDEEKKISHFDDFVSSLCLKTALNWSYSVADALLTNILSDFPCIVLLKS